MRCEVRICLAISKHACAHHGALGSPQVRICLAISKPVTTRLVVSPKVKGGRALLSALSLLSLSCLSQL